MSSIELTATAPPLASPRRLVPRVAPRRALDLASNVMLMSAMWLAYSWVRTLTSDEFRSALRHARVVLNVQNTLRLPSEAALQRVVLDVEWLVEGANRYYLYVHFPLTVLFLAWTFGRRWVAFPVIRTALMITTFSALVLHVAFPLAPPRMMAGFVDTGRVFGPSPYDLSASESANQIAAMPSMHVGWALIVAIGCIVGMRGRWRWLALAHPVLTTLVVVVTANHYWSDAIVAIVLVAGGWYIAIRIHVRRDVTSLAGRAVRRHHGAADDVEELGLLSQPVGHEVALGGGRGTLERCEDLEGGFEGLSLSVAGERSGGLDRDDTVGDVGDRRLHDRVDRIG
jgi:hypothetical protein